MDSRPSLSRPIVYPVAIPVPLVSFMAASVDLHRTALDSVCPGGPTQNIRPAEQDLSGLRERDTGGPALENDFLFRGQYQPLLINFGMDRWPGRPGLPQLAENYWPGHIPLLERDRHLPANVGGVQRDRPASGNRPTKRIARKSDSRRSAVVESGECGHDNPVNPGRR